MTDWTAKPLVLGAGETCLEMFLEPTCPFSAAAFGKIEPLVARAGDRVAVRVWLHSQPWHLMSPIACRAIAGVSTLEEGRAAALRLMEAIYDRREDFSFEDHAGGPNRRRTPEEILSRMEEASGLPVREAFDRPGVEDIVKHHAKYARQNGIHGSPTVMVGGLVRDDIGSGDDVETWVEKILG